jgi:hypothetical protein
MLDHSATLVCLPSHILRQTIHTIYQSLTHIVNELKQRTLAVDHACIRSIESSLSGPIRTVLRDDRQV